MTGPQEKPTTLDRIEANAADYIGFVGYVEKHELLALVAVARAARELDSWQPQTPMGLQSLHPQEREAVVANREALARLDGAR